jgi:two-component system, LuxR family, response regulator DctR
LVVTGKPNKQIAAALGVSIKAVEAHRSRLMRKMGVQNSIELVHMVLADEG